MENNMKKILGFASMPDYSGNCKALYENLKNRKLDKYKLIWFVKSEEEKARLNKVGIDAICENDPEFEESLKKVDVMFITHDQYIDKKQERQIFVSLWHGIGPKRSGYALNDEEEIKFVNKYKDIIDYICVPSEFTKMLFSYIYNIENSKILIMPYQRNKYIYESNGKNNIYKLTNYNPNDYEKIIMYTPTFRKGIGKEEGEINKDNILNLKKYEEKRLKDFLEKNNYLLIVKLHPSEEIEINKNNFSKNIILLEDSVMNEKMITINEILNGVDCLITDYSSIYTDYLLLERPVMFINTDIEKYSKKRGILFDSPNFWFPGPTIDNIEDFMEQLEWLLKDNSYYAKEREQYTKIVLGNEYKNTDKFIDDFILKLEPKIKIPKKIHYFKKDKYTNKEIENIKQWKEIFKEYEIIEWDLNCPEIQNIIKEEKLKKDEELIIKFKILYKYGGVFLDTDIQILRDIEHLLIENNLLIIEDEYGICNNKIVGSSQENNFIKDCVERKWLGINSWDNVRTYKKKDLFVGADEQFRIGDKYFQDNDKYFNEINITAKEKIRRIARYGLIIKS